MKTDFAPEKKRVGAVNLANVIAQSRDQKATKSEDLGLTAEVFCPGVPNGDPEDNNGWGVVLTVKKFTGFEATQLAWKIKQQPEPDDAKLFAAQQELSSAESRSSWWRDIWRLVYGLTDESKAFLAAVAMKKPDAKASDFGPELAIYWMRVDESAEVAEPLLQAINILNYYAKSPVRSSSELDAFKTAPEVIGQLGAAYQGGFLKDYITGDPDVLAWVVDNVGLLSELIDFVDEKKARRLALFIKDAVRQALREVHNELRDADVPTPVPHDVLHREMEAALERVESQIDHGDAEHIAKMGGLRMEVVETVAEAPEGQES